MKFNANRHYQQLVRVWQHYRWEPCPLRCLPKIGYVVEGEDGKFIAALFMYASSGEVAFIDWGVGSMEHNRDEIHGAFRVLFEKLKEIAKRMGCNFIFSMSKVSAFKEILIENGLQIAEERTTSFVLPLIDKDFDFITD